MALLQQAGDGGRGIEDSGPREPTKAIEVASVVGHGGNDGKAVTAAELEVLQSAAWRNVDEPGAFLGGDLLLGNDAMLDAALDGEVIEGPDVAQPH